MSDDTDEKIIKDKLGLLKLAEMLGNVSEACKVMGYSRDGFYRLQLYENGWGAGLARELLLEDDFAVSVQANQMKTSFYLNQCRLS